VQFISAILSINKFNKTKKKKKNNQKEASLQEACDGVINPEGAIHFSKSRRNYRKYCFAHNILLQKMKMTMRKKW